MDDATVENETAATATSGASSVTAVTAAVAAEIAEASSVVAEELAFAHFKTAPETVMGGINDNDADVADVADVADEVDEDILQVV